MSSDDDVVVLQPLNGACRCELCGTALLVLVSTDEGGITAEQEIAVHRETGRVYHHGCWVAEKEHREEEYEQFLRRCAVASYWDHDEKAIEKMKASPWLREMHTNVGAEVVAFGSTVGPWGDFHCPKPTDPLRIVIGKSNPRDWMVDPTLFSLDSFVTPMCVSRVRTDGVLSHKYFRAFSGQLQSSNLCGKFLNDIKAGDNRIVGSVDVYVFLTDYGSNDEDIHIVCVPRAKNSVIQQLVDAAVQNKLTYGEFCSRAHETVERLRTFATRVVMGPLCTYVCAQLSRGASRREKEDIRPADFGAWVMSNVYSATMGRLHHRGGSDESSVCLNSIPTGDGQHYTKQEIFSLYQQADSPSVAQLDETGIRGSREHSVVPLLVREASDLSRVGLLGSVTFRIWGTRTF